MLSLDLGLVFEFFKLAESLEVPHRTDGTSEIILSPLTGIHVLAGFAVEFLRWHGDRLISTCEILVLFLMFEL